MLPCMNTVQQTQSSVLTWNKAISVLRELQDMSEIRWVVCDQLYYLI